MPRSFLVKKLSDRDAMPERECTGSGCTRSGCARSGCTRSGCTEELDSSFDSGCEHSDQGEEIDVVGDDEATCIVTDTQELTPRPPDGSCHQPLSPAGAIAMVAGRTAQRKTSPSIAPQIFNSRAKSLSPIYQSRNDADSNMALKYSDLSRYSDPKFWQNTLSSITHHYVSPFNFHRLPHAILAGNSQAAHHSAPYQPCLPLASPVALSNYAMAAQGFLRSPMQGHQIPLAALSRFSPGAQAKTPFAFVQGAPSGLMFPGVRASMQVNHKLCREQDMAAKLSPDQAALKIHPAAIPLNNNTNVSKTLPWLHDLPYNIPKDLDASGERHIKRQHEPPRYQCDACNKSYATFSGLSKHKQFHCESHVKKEFSCKYCDKTYNSLGALKMHIRTHTLPCKCQICGKAFSRPWLLQGHLRTHTGEKPFSCQVCGRAFADRSNLRAHLQTHSDIKKYSCTDCAKTFSRMSLLVKHKEGSCPGIRSSTLQTMISAAV